MTDQRNVDALARALGTETSRRRVLRILLGGATTAAVGSTLAGHDAAATCLPTGARCNHSHACCGGACVLETRWVGRRRLTTGICVPICYGVVNGVVQASVC